MKNLIKNITREQKAVVAHRSAAVTAVAAAQTPLKII